MSQSQPFDHVAQDYDATFTETQTGKLQRQQVYKNLSQILQDTDIQDVLEINCGTGVDAAWMARNGKTVLATDISSEMVSVAQMKAKRLPVEVQQRLDFECQSITDLDLDRSYDLVFSNFGGLNCLSPEELKTFLAKSSSLVRPGGWLVLVIMGRFCWWETLYFSLKGQFATAWRRISRTPSIARLEDNSSIPTWYYSPSDILRNLEPYTRPVIRPIGFFTPPSYLEPFFQKRPRLLGMLDRLESVVNGWSWAAWGSDHYYLAVKRGEN